MLWSAHAGAVALQISKEFPKEKAVIINMSGRGDKDIFITSPVFRPLEWEQFLQSELDRLKNGTDIHYAESLPTNLKKELENK